ncbi:type II toxin-antitoxin system RelE/ParE family toxin [Neorhizobium sp. T25_27]|jgi:toxin ParE1/3/4|uniref:type II toxin-antitoxin system RelE/ParE family toxin n=1 Tax=Neorhizobium sp. T25_27 TaxID=2093831 RepID=UPI000CF85A2E|nr:type II toxin-antitoxin system RelE/ParE family toxin [Neorhizobium sp. T25_27]
MDYEVRLSEESENDLALIFDHLIDVHLSLGEAVEDAISRATARIRRIEDDIFSIGRFPYKGTLTPEVAVGLRHVTKGRAIIYFDVYEQQELVQIIAVFFGGQDHQRHMLERLGVAASRGGF